MKIIAYPHLRIFFLFICAISMPSMGLQAQDKMPEGFNPKRHMKVSEVKHRMQGYALTVFEGVEIEALPVRVISVENGSSPGKAVVWVECTSERMRNIGPVQGMSGSPVFLWDEDTPEEERVLGKGGRMLGALAFGYSMTRRSWCAFGVQPIEYMIAAGNRTELPEQDKKAQANRQQLRAPLSLTRQLISLPSEALQLDELNMWRLKQIAKLHDIKSDRDQRQPSAWQAPDHIARKAQVNQQWIPTLNVGSPEHAAFLTHLFKGTRIQPVGLKKAGGGQPPQWIDPEKIKPTPGGVLSVPIVSGDADWASIGTITEVLPDGTVLGFGHSMFGQGALQMPMSTGFVHFIHPSMQNSFKLGGSLKQVGAILNDEMVAVVGKPEVSSPWVPIKVKVKWPDPTKNGEFKYYVVDHPDYLARALPYMAAYSVTGDTDMPQRFTVDYKYVLRFEGDREMVIAGRQPMMAPNGTVSMPASVIDAMTNNSEGVIKLISAEAEMEIIEKDLSLSMMEVRLDKTEVKPGETITATVKLRAYREEPYYKQIQLKIPEDAEEGKWPLVVGGASDYYGEYFAARSYLLSYEGMDELFEAYKALFSETSTGIYMVATSPKRQISLGRTPLPPMPESRLRTMIESPGARVGVWSETIHTHQNSEYVVRGGQVFTITVSKSN